MPTVQVTHHLELDPPKLPDEVLQVAVKQGEDPDKVCAYLDEFRQMIYEKGEFTLHRDDDKFLLKFLRARFFKLEHCYSLLSRYYEFHENNKIFFDDVHPLLLRPVGDYDIISVFPYREQTGRRIMIYKLGNWQPAKTPVEDLFRVTLILLEVGSLEPQAQILGGIGLFDLEGFTLNHCWNMSPTYAKKIIEMMVSVMPMRTTAIHVVNQGWAFDVCFQMFKPFLNERMRNQIFFHGSDMESLHKHIHPDHLPVRYGGCLPEYSYSKWVNKLVHNDKIMNELKNLFFTVTDEEIEDVKKNYKEDD